MIFGVMKIIPILTFSRKHMEVMISVMMLIVHRIMVKVENMVVTSAMMIKEIK